MKAPQSHELQQAHFKVPGKNKMANHYCHLPLKRINYTFLKQISLIACLLSMMVSVKSYGQCVPPTVNTISNQVVCNATATAAVNFTGGAPGTVYSWTNNTPSIGLASSGTGNIPSFTATNAGNTALTATITVTPFIPGTELAYIPNFGDNTVSVINTSTNTVVTTITVGTSPLGVTVSPDGNRVYITNYDGGTVSVINTATNTVSATLTVGTFPTGVIVSPDGTRLYVLNNGTGTVSVFNTSTNALISTVTLTSGLTGVTVSPDGSRLYVANAVAGTISVINTSTNALITTINVGTNPYGVTISPDGSRVYVANNGSANVTIINTVTNTVVTTTSVGNNPYGVTLSPDGSRLYVANLGSNSVSIINTSSNLVISTINVGSQPAGVSVSSDGSLVYVYVVSERSNSVSVINASTNSVIADIPVGKGPFAFGNFIKPGLTPCKGTPKQFTITVNTKPTISSTASLLDNNTTGQCGKIITYNSSFTGAPTPTISYEFKGVTIATGSGNGSGSFFNVGTTNVILSATNSCGVGTHTFDITIKDTEKPTISCPPNQSITLGSFECSRPVIFTDPSVSDNCPDVNLKRMDLTTISSGVSLSPGIYNLKYRATDKAGNTADCGFTIQVNGQLSSSRLTCIPTLTVSLDERQCASILDGPSLLTNGVYYCPSFYNTTITGKTNSTFTSADIGKTFTVTVSDNFNNRCSTLVSVVDIKAPVLNAPLDAIISCADVSQDGRILTDLALPSVIYECSKTTFSFQDKIINLPVGQTSFNTRPDGFPAGKNFDFAAAYGSSKIIVRTYTATDESNNSSTIQRVIYVKNIELSQVECPKDVTVACVQGDFNTSIQSTGTPVIKNSRLVQDASCGIDYLFSDERVDNAQGYLIKRTWTFISRLNNQRQSCVQTITVNDTKPTLTCPASKTVTIGADKKVVVLASSVGTASDNCTPANALVWSITQGTSTNTSLTYICADLGNKAVQISVKDAAGNTSSCNTMIQVVDPSNFCVNIPLLAISGNINKETGENISATVKVFQSNSPMADMEGSSFQFNNLVQGNSYRVQPERDNDIYNGVTTFDIALISKHVLDIQPFTSPYQMIAADVNRDGEVDGLDMILIRNLVLRRITRFPNNNSWRFIPKNFIFKDSKNPFADDFPEALNYNNISTDINKADFIAVKVGDVNLNAKANVLALSTRTARPTENIYLVDKKMEAGKEYIVDLNINNSTLAALQLALKIDKTNVATFSVQEGNLPQFESGNFEVNQKQGIVGMAWVNTKREVFSNENSIIQLRITPRQSAWLHELVSLEEQNMENLSYDTEGVEKQLQLKFSNLKTDNVVFELHQNRPNPFMSETTISFNLPETNTAELSVYDINGKQIYNLNKVFTKGFNEVKLDNSVIKNTGVYFYRLQSDKFTAVKRMQYFTN